MTNPNPNDELVIEDNKTVRRNRSQGCTCTWIWVDGSEPGDVEPAIDLPYAQSCPVHTT